MIIIKKLFLNFCYIIYEQTEEPLIVFEIHMFRYLGKISIQIFSFFKRLNFNFEHFFLYHISAHDVRCDNKTTLTGQGAYYIISVSPMLTGVITKGMSLIRDNEKKLYWII
jgi:hypothetical protein